MHLGTREQAIVHAYAAAALVFEIGRYCALNKIRYCSCGMTGATEMIVSPEGSQMSRFPQGALPTSKRVKRQVDMNSFRRINDAIAFQPGGGGQAGGGGQPPSQVQNTHYWSGCPDNVDTATNYVAQFLGFDEKRLHMVGYHPPARDAPAPYETPFQNPAPLMPESPLESQPFGFYSPPSTNAPPEYISRKVRRAVKDEEDINEVLYRVARRAKKKRKNPTIRLSNQHNYMAGAWVSDLFYNM